MKVNEIDCSDDAVKAINGIVLDLQKWFESGSNNGA